MALAAVAATSTTADDLASPGPTSVVPENNWPDPQFCMQDNNAGLAAVNDALDGTIPPIAVSGYTTGSRTIVCSCSATAGLLVGSLISFDRPADAVLTANGLWRVTAIVPNVSFTVFAEAWWGRPTASFACYAHVNMRGATSTSGSGNVTGNCFRFDDCTVWISERPAHTSLLIGCKRVLVVELGPSGTAAIYWQPSSDHIAAMQGTKRAVGVAVYVASGVGAQAQAFFNNGAISKAGAVAATKARTWVTNNGIVGAHTYQAGVSLTGPPGSFFVLGEFTECARGVALPDGSFSTPRAQTIRFPSSVSPWIGLTITAPPGFTVSDMKQVSDGVINEGVSWLSGLWEGQSQSVGAGLTSCAHVGGSLIFNPILKQYIVGTDSDPTYYALASGNFNVGDDARFSIYGSAVPFKHLSFDLSTATLFAGP